MPYIFYQKLISDYSHKGSFVLEIGAGMGENTKFLLATEAKVCATDISEYSLSVIEKRFNNDKQHLYFSILYKFHQALYRYPHNSNYPHSL
jgi:ubiquinone/menaquinone biosynthesis C-methylase UbiE